MYNSYTESIGNANTSMLSGCRSMFERIYEARFLAMRLITDNEIIYCERSFSERFCDIT